jgi:phosphoenolpyruvate carboxykinase (ATP)
MKINLIDIDLIAEIQNEGNKVIDGVVYFYTGKCTGRSPNAKRIVKDSETKDDVDWDNNNSISPDEWRSYLHKFETYLKKSFSKLYKQDVVVVRDPLVDLHVRVFTETAVHSLFARNMFVPYSDTNVDPKFVPDWDIYHFPSLLDSPTVLISFSEKKILIAGTSYSGEIKKSIFTVLNYTFAKDNTGLPMHCSVNMDLDRGNPAIFFGLSGTGKTTLSSDSNRILIGDDEHAWTDTGLTNFEGGCYAKTIRLSQADEPEIWEACYTEGTILENVVLNETMPDFNDAKYTENCRASYALSSIPNSDPDGYVRMHPKNIIMLTCDAFGVLPPVSKLTTDEAVKQFSLGYTAKIAGTEDGIVEPIATFSPCFGGPFMPLPVSVYAKILKEKIDKHDVKCWLVNTGWTGGPYGLGNRISIKTTRTIINRILDGSLMSQATKKHKYTGFTVPFHPNLKNDILFPENSWSDLSAYEKKVKELTTLFDEKSLELFGKC